MCTKAASGIWAGAILAALAGCGSVSSDNAGDAAKVAEWETLDSGQAYWGSCEPSGDRLIRTDAEWAAYWTDTHSGSSEPRPVVDFNEDSVVAVCGNRPTPGYAAEVTDVRVAGSVATVTVTEHEPGENCANPDVLIFVHHAVGVRGVLSAADFTHQPLPGPAC